MKIVNLKLKSELYSDKTHYIIIAIILLAISLYIYFIIFILIIYLIFIFKRKLLNKGLIIFLFIFIIYFLLNYYLLNISALTIRGNVLINEVKENYFTFYYKGSLYMSYTKIDLKPGDIINIVALKQEFLSPSYLGDFNTLTFLKGKNIKNIYDIEEYNYLNYLITFKRLRYLIEEFYKDKISSEYYELFCCLTLGDNIILDSSSYAKLNILHVLALSGFHLILIYNFLFKLFFKITKRYNFSINLVLILLLFYTLLCGGTPSLFRALIFLILQKMNKRYDLLFTKLDLYSLTFLILLIKPLTIYNIGFIFSQLASFIILYLNDFNKSKNKFIKEIKNGFIFLLVSLPFTSNLTNNLSIFSLVSFLFANIITTIFIPICFIFLIIPNLSYFLEFLIIGFNNQISTFSSVFLIKFPYMNNYFKIIYYSILILLFINISKGKKIFKINIILILFYLIYLPSGYYSINEVTFLDCGQGDSTFIKAKDKCYLIDCYNSYDYLVKRGIYKLDAIFISHSDSDHLGDLEEIIENIDVKIVYYSVNDIKTKEILVGKNVMHKAIKYQDVINLGGSEIKVLSKYKYDNTNDNSLILQIELANLSYLFVGDITSVAELNILDNLEEIDVLKVAHHGSDTSSSLEFLAKTKPKYAIISAGFLNKYGFPNENVVNNLEKYAKVYLTYECGNISFKNEVVKTYKNVV